MSAAVHINRPRWSRHEKRRLRCPNCQKRRTFYCFFQEWYGWAVTCIGCGDMWTDGEHHPRPFEPGWRKRNIASARRNWEIQEPKQ